MPVLWAASLWDFGTSISGATCSSPSDHVYTSHAYLQTFEIAPALHMIVSNQLFPARTRSATTEGPRQGRSITSWLEQHDRNGRRALVSACACKASAACSWWTPRASVVTKQQRASSWTRQRTRDRLVSGLSAAQRPAADWRL